MYALKIDNPTIGRLAKEVFEKDPVSTNAEFYQFLQHQKLKQDLKESLEQAEKGQYSSEEDTFDQLFSEFDL